MQSVSQWVVRIRIAQNAGLHTSSGKGNATNDALIILFWILIHRHAKHFNVQTIAKLA